MLYRLKIRLCMYVIYVFEANLWKYRIGKDSLLGGTYVVAMFIGPVFVSIIFEIISLSKLSFILCSRCGFKRNAESSLEFLKILFKLYKYDFLYFLSSKLCKYDYIILTVFLDHVYL